MKKNVISLAIAACFAVSTILAQADSQQEQGNIIKKKSDTSERSAAGIPGGTSASDTLGVIDPSGSSRVIDPSGAAGVMVLPGTSGGMDGSGSSYGLNKGLKYR